jgi:hypothetical protein
MIKAYWTVRTMKIVTIHNMNGNQNKQTEIEKCFLFYSIVINDWHRNYALN